MSAYSAPCSGLSTFPKVPLSRNKQTKSLLWFPHSLPITIILLCSSSLPNISQKSCTNILSSLSWLLLHTVYSFMALTVLPKSVDFFHYASHFNSHTVNVQKKVKARCYFRSHNNTFSWFLLLHCLCQLCLLN